MKGLLIRSPIHIAPRVLYRIKHDFIDCPKITRALGVPYQAKSVKLARH